MCYLHDGAGFTSILPAFLVGKNPLLGPLNELALLENYTPTPNRAARFFFSTKYYCCPEMGKLHWTRK